ncbi:SigE family RNA polymerase sigma factor [Kineosporia succinea]|uniref:RNA polymerase sigma-70 factor (Sigma-E family) n=1 Tax=Kineosporia succinea TaxID=84632 RepID=A0ABT9PFW4_9ACTN|nr:SigE family RNA polymerase sigma factor [Kineosporia succinea]MDP9831284.1 RNA polymerase sigma-70 factor (sigma-E family) [Kineosporia succinea]
MTGADPHEVLTPLPEHLSSQPPPFEEYVSARLPDLLRLGHALAGNPHDASDLVQDVLEKVGVRWTTLHRRGENVDAYVRRAMVNARTTRWRRRRRETLVAFSVVGLDRAVLPHDRFDDEPLWQALRDLPAKQRAVLVLRFYEGLTESEIAATLGIAVGTVKSHTSRAMSALRQTLAHTGSGGETPRTPEGGTR